MNRFIFIFVSAAYLTSFSGTMCASDNKVPDNKSRIKQLIQTFTPSSIHKKQLWKSKISPDKHKSKTQIATNTSYKTPTPLQPTTHFSTASIEPGFTKHIIIDIPTPSSVETVPSSRIDSHPLASLMQDQEPIFHEPIAGAIAPVAKPSTHLADFSALAQLLMNPTYQDQYAACPHQATGVSEESEQRKLNDLLADASNKLDTTCAQYAITIGAGIDSSDNKHHKPPFVIAWLKQDADLDRKTQYVDVLLNMNADINIYAKIIHSSDLEHFKNRAPRPVEQFSDSKKQEAKNSLLLHAITQCDAPMVKTALDLGAQVTSSSTVLSNTMLKPAIEHLKQAVDQAMRVNSIVTMLNDKMQAEQKEQNKSEDQS